MLLLLQVTKQGAFLPSQSIRDPRRDESLGFMQRGTVKEVRTDDNGTDDNGSAEQRLPGGIPW